ncbi:hydrogenase [Candidatus Woesearchaeota archaeon]|nr:hydrogenase [Candidatus Woesearchaeota archaeon]
MNNTLSIGTVMWSPVTWLIAAILILLLVLIIRSFGNKRYAKGTAQTKPFLSGNTKDPGGDARAADIYWGFFDAFKAFYKPMVRCHTGIVNDYLGIFIIVLAAALLAILLT